MKHTRQQILVLLLSLGAMFPLGVSAQVVIITQPQSQSDLLLGDSMTLRVQATGSGPLSYQWRLNGVNIPGANNASFPIAGFQSSDSGDYSVAVSDDAGAVSSAVARVREKYPPELPFTDNMNGRNTISGLSGTGVGSNEGATREPGEPNHAGKHGANSIWVTWTSGLLGGVVTLDTAGSSFDTLLAVYTRDSVSNLTLVAANDDDFTCSDSTRAFHTSKVRFNARASTVYHIAVDGLEGATGDVTFHWNVNVLERLLSVLNVVPTVTVGLPGDNLTLSVSAQGIDPVTYQWYLNCQPIPGATQNAFQILDLQPSKVGSYTVRVQDLLTGEETISESADVQINSTDGRLVDVPTINKFSEIADLARAAQTASSRLQKTSLRSSPIGKHSGGLATGYTGTQIFSTYGSTKDPGETNHCGVAGGASQWYTYVPPTNGLLYLDTDGSDYDTVLAVYIVPPGKAITYANLVSVACDNHNGIKGGDVVAFDALDGVTYYVVVDGVNGAQGIAHLNYQLNVSPHIVSPPADQTVPPGAGVTLTVSFTGTPTPACQWQFNGFDITGATGTSFTIAGFQAGNEGDYAARVSNAAGSVTSAPAMLLLAAPLRLDSFALNSGGQPGFRLIGAVNVSYLIEVSANLTDWTPLATNSSPTGVWDFTDAAAAGSQDRFFRARSVP